MRKKDKPRKRNRGHHDRLKAKARRFSYKWEGITKERFQVLIAERIGKRCLYCPTILDTENMSADHRDPQSKQGTSTEENLALICKTCNITKGNFSEEQFLALLTIARQFKCEESLRTRLRASNLVFGRRG